MKPVKLIPYTCGVGGSVPGAEQGPLDLEASGLIESLRSHGYDADWYQSPSDAFTIDEGQDAHNSYPDLGTNERKQIMLRHCQRLHDQVSDVVKGGGLPFSVGGDHSMAAGSISGMAKAKDAYGRIGVLWIDAHPDINTMETSSSKAMHGMPIAALFGMGDPDYVAICGEQAVLKPENIFFMGVRDIDEGEQTFIRDLGIQSLTAKEAYEMGLENALAMAMETITKNTDTLFLSFDLDSLEPAEVPATGTPVPEGFRADDLLPLLSDVVNKYQFDGLEISEYNPTLRGRDQTRAIMDRLFEALLPQRLRSLQEAS